MENIVRHSHFQYSRAPFLIHTHLTPNFGAASFISNRNGFGDTKMVDILQTGRTMKCARKIPDEMLRWGGDELEERLACLAEVMVSVEVYSGQGLEKNLYPWIRFQGRRVRHLVRTKVVEGNSVADGRVKCVSPFESGLLDPE
jgi:hypothetical protein